MTQLFYWRDEPILDIELWASERKERMVDIVWEVKQVNPYAGKNAISYSEEKETMPESFFHTLMIDENRRVKKYTYRKPKGIRVITAI